MRKLYLDRKTLQKPIYEQVLKVKTENEHSYLVGKSKVNISSRNVNIQLTNVFGLILRRKCKMNYANNKQAR